MPATDSANSSEPERPIGFVDSGVGGLPYLEWAREHLAGEGFVYLADRANFPYGTKTHDQVFAAVSAAVEKLIRSADPKMIVLACNTASVVSLAGLRTLYPQLPFVGVVPAIKPAGERSRNRRFGVLATARTVDDPYVNDLISRFAPDCQVLRLAGGDIVSFVEKRLFTSTKSERVEVIREAVGQLLRAGVDSVVLGCTHFLYVKEELHELLGPGIEIIDSTEGVGRQIERILGGARPCASGSGDDRMFVTGLPPVEEQYHAFARRFGLEFAGLL
jgi:glutamate racemase